MILRMSTLFVRTLRDDPADAEVPSHRLLVRAGYIRRSAPGIYTWLPLGLRVLANVERIIREEMDRIGAQELLFPALLPREPYEASGRWTEYGPGIFRLKDRKGGDYLLGPTHEEMFTLVVKDMYSSYKDLPLSLYQIQTKYRDEARPRAGILRGREFIMKDSYSFDTSDAGLTRRTPPHRRPTSGSLTGSASTTSSCPRTSGAMGGSKSEEFLAKADIGEDTFVECKVCGYAANVEAVRVRAARADVVRRHAGSACGGHPRHADDRDPGRPAQRRSSRARTGLGRRRHAQEPARHGHATPAVRASRWPSAYPATARSTRSGSRQRCTRPRSSRSARRTSPSSRTWRRATSAPVRSARSRPPRSGTWSTRASPSAPAG